jgi:ATP-dependent helicase HrpB
VLKEQQPLASEPYIVAADLADGGADSRIFAAAPVTEQALHQHLAAQIEATLTVGWDSRVKAVRAVKCERLGALVLKEEVVAACDREQVLAALLQGFRLEGLKILPWTPAGGALLNRLRFIQQLEPDWPDFGEDCLLRELENWLAPYLNGIRNAQQLDRIKLGEALLARLSWAQQQTLNQSAPTHLAVPSGRQIAVDYSDPAAPVLAVKLQEMFGATDTPAIAGGRVPVTLQLLSPAGRPIQVTRDLASFWRQGYFAVKKDLKGRYPKHYWPEDPMAAVPTSRVRPREGDSR